MGRDQWLRSSKLPIASRRKYRPTVVRSYDFKKEIAIIKRNLYFHVKSFVI